jgi:hypothetical protein
MITQAAQAVNPGPADFLAALYGDRPPGWLVAWTRQDRVTRWLPAGDHDEAARQAMTLAGNYDIYFGVGVQGDKGRTNQRGKADTVIAIPGLWLDVDCRGGAHSATNLPTLDEARSLVGLFGLQPSVVVHTGGGVHVYWIFRRPWVFRDSSDRQRAADQVAGFQRGMIALAAARDWRLDNTSDLARVLRLPGTTNRKMTPRAPVTVVGWHPERRYSYQDVEAAIERLEIQAAAARQAAGGGDRRGTTQAGQGDQERQDTGPLPRADLIAQSCAWIMRCRVNAATLAEPEWYGMVGVIARCQDGAAIVHKWSRAYPRYSERETDAKIKHAMEDAGPITCERVRQNFGGWCMDCPHRVTSPVVLGRERQTPAWRPVSPSLNGT